MRQILRLLSRHPQPSYAEIGAELKVTSGRVAQLLRGLEWRGLIRRTGKARSIEVLT